MMEILGIPRSFFAALITLLVPGVPAIGHMYLGRTYRAAAAFFLTLFGGGFLFGWLAESHPVESWTFQLVFGGVGLLWFGVLAVDAYRCGEQPSPDAPEKVIAPEDRASGFVLTLWAAYRWAGNAFAGFLVLGLVIMAWSLAFGALRSGSGWALLFSTQPAALAVLLAGYSISDAVGTYAVYSGEIPGARSEMLSALKTAAFNFIVVFGVVGLLISIAAPGFVNLIRFSEDGATRGGLGSLRAALHEYETAHDGSHPSEPAALVPDLLFKIPSTKIRQSYFRRQHPESARVLIASEKAFTDEGGWLYLPGKGEIFVNCTHTDAKGNVWSSY